MRQPLGNRDFRMADNGNDGKRQRPCEAYRHATCHPDILACTVQEPPERCQQEHAAKHASHHPYVPYVRPDKLRRLVRIRCNHDFHDGRIRHRPIAPKEKQFTSTKDAGRSYEHAPNDTAQSKRTQNPRHQRYKKQPKQVFCQKSSDSHEKLLSAQTRKHTDIRQTEQQHDSKESEASL